MPKTELIIHAAYNYSKCSADDKGKLICLAADANRLIKKDVEAIIAIGRTLSAAQEILAKHGNGAFGKWVKAETPYSPRTAYRCISAFATFGDCATVAQMEVSAVYQLAENATPKSAVKEAVKLAESGVRISQASAKKIIKKHVGPKPSKPSGNGKPEPAVTAPAPAPPPETAPKPARGEPKVDRRKFDEFESAIGKLVRQNTALKEHAGGPQFHEAIRRHLNGVLEVLEQWKESALK